MKSLSLTTAASNRLNTSSILLLLVLILLVSTVNAVNITSIQRSSVNTNSARFLFQHQNNQQSILSTITTSLTISSKRTATMSKQFLDALASRRSYYQLLPKSTISDNQIQAILKRILHVVPSSYNTQSTRMLLLLHDDHRKLWSSTLSILEDMQKATDVTRGKLTNFGNAYGTVLFFEDQDILDAVSAKLPSFAANAAQWSEHTNAMHQIATWTALEAEGLGANLQHYHPVIDEMVQRNWGIKTTWKLKAQLVFGSPAAQPAPRNDEGKLSLDERLLVAGAELPN